MANLATVGQVTVNVDCDRRKCKCWCHAPNVVYLAANDRPHVPECAFTHYPNAKARKREGK